MIIECKENHCLKESKTAGFCIRHYKNYLKYGKPDGKFIRCSNETSIQDRLNAKSKLNLDNGCVEWMGTINKKSGYGGITINGKRFFCHRVSWEEKHKMSAKGLVIRHICDNPKCINSSHLLSGTQKDNMKDKIVKDRQLKGTQIWNSKLNEKDIKDIIFMNRQGKSISELGKIYNITVSAIGNICKRKRWKHVEILL